jgi:hypothetical protein
MLKNEKYSIMQQIHFFLGGLKAVLQNWTFPGMSIFENRPELLKSTLVA